MGDVTTKEDLDAAVRMGDRIFELEGQLAKATEELRVHRAARDSILSCANSVAASAETFDAEALESVLGQRIWDESFVVADGESMRRWIARSIDLDRELRARDEARAAIGEAWFHDGATLAEAIERKTRALESMPGAAAVALLEAVLGAHRDDIPPRIRELAKDVQCAVAEYAGGRRAADERVLDAMRREKAALDQVETLRAEVAAKNAEIKRLNDVIGEMSE